MKTDSKKVIGYFIIFVLLFSLVLYCLSIGGLVMQVIGFIVACGMIYISLKLITFKSKSLIKE